MDTSNHADGYESRTDSEEEEEIMFLVFPTLYCISSRREKIPYNTSILTGAKYIREILDGHPQRCPDILRMESHIFQALCDHLRSKNLLRNSRGVSVGEQLGMFMYMLSRNASYGTLIDRFQHSPEIVHRHINGCFNAMISLAFDLIKHSSSDTHCKISTHPQFWPFFENCLGAIYGTHVPMTIASSEAAPYRNRKGTLSQNLMVACDFDLKVVYVSAGWEGSASDAGVLKSSFQSGFHVPTGKYYLVDGGYANTPQFLAPYHGVRYHLQDFGRGGSRPKNAKELFNLRHARLRNHIERAIGVWEMRFPILKVGMHYPIDTQVKIAVAAAVFHNIIRGEVMKNG
nr:putative nuclease HARBI1 [Aegilops tauschii subsp. strangulata]XP_045087833.1 putative nuclease HARBI1 [Aegilops tauschii subsp. strangulata]